MININAYNVNTAFQGSLQRKFGKDIYTKAQLNGMFAKANEEEKQLGSLPESWVKKFLPEEIGEKTSEIFDLFSKFSIDVCEAETKEHEAEKRKMHELELELASIRCADFYSNKIVQDKWKEYAEYLEKVDSIPHGERYKEICEGLSSRLSKMLNEECSVKYLDNGAYGLAFQIVTSDEELVLKAYRPLETEPTYHGSIVEPATAIYLNRVIKPERCTKFYCAKLESHKKGGGFMLTKYVEPEESFYDGNKIEQIGKWILNKGLSANKFHFGDIKMDDPYKGNFINGTLVDFGGVTFTYKSKKEYEIMKALSAAIKNEDFEAICKIEEKYGECEEFKTCKKRLEAYLAGIMDYK